MQKYYLDKALNTTREMASAEQCIAFAHEKSPNCASGHLFTVFCSGFVKILRSISGQNRAVLVSEQ